MVALHTTVFASGVVQIDIRAERASKKQPRNPAGLPAAFEWSSFDYTPAAMSCPSHIVQGLYVTIAGKFAQCFQDLFRRRFYFFCDLSRCDVTSHLFYYRQ